MPDGRRRWPGRQALQPGYLVAQRMVLGTQRHNRRLLRIQPGLQSQAVGVQPLRLINEAADNVPQLGKREPLQQCCIRQRHAACESLHRPQRKHPARESAPVTYARHIPLKLNDFQIGIFSRKVTTRPLSKRMFQNARFYPKILMHT